MPIDPGLLVDTPADCISDWMRREKSMTVIPCPVCGLPNTKAAAPITLANGHKQWIRLRRYDSCHCVLSPSQDADVLRFARSEERSEEIRLSSTNGNKWQPLAPSDTGRE